MPASASELQRQLALHRAVHQLPSPGEAAAACNSSASRVKAAPSFLFDVRDAAAVDVETLRDLALQSLAALSRRQPLFHLLTPLFSPAATGATSATAFDSSLQQQQHEDPLFASFAAAGGGGGAQKPRAREFLLPAEECVLEARIRLCCDLLGPFFLLPDAHNVIEYLVRMHAAHRFSAEALLFVALPFHASLLATRLFRLLQLPQNSPWSCCLSKLQQHTPHTRPPAVPASAGRRDTTAAPHTASGATAAATTLTRPVLVQCCVESPALFFSLADAFKRICLDGVTTQRLAAAHLLSTHTIAAAESSVAAAGLPDMTSDASAALGWSAGPVLQTQQQWRTAAEVATDGSSSRTSSTSDSWSSPIVNQPLLSLFTRVVLETVARAPSLRALRPLLPPLVPLLLDALRPPVAVASPETHAAAAAICAQLARRAPLEQTVLLSVVQQLSLALAALAAAPTATGVGPLQQVQLRHARRLQQHRIVAVLVLLTQQQPLLQHCLPSFAVRTLAKHAEALATSLHALAYDGSVDCAPFVVAFFRAVLSFFCVPAAEAACAEAAAAAAPPAAAQAAAPAGGRLSVVSSSSGKKTLSPRQRRLLSAAETLCVTLSRDSSRDRLQPELQQQAPGVRFASGSSTSSSHCSWPAGNVAGAATAGCSTPSLLVVIALTLFDAFDEALRTAGGEEDEEEGRGETEMQETGEEEAAAARTTAAAATLTEATARPAAAAGRRSASAPGGGSLAEGAAGGRPAAKGKKKAAGVAAELQLHRLRKRQPMLLNALQRLLQTIESVAPLALPAAFSFSAHAAAVQQNSSSSRWTQLLLLSELFDQDAVLPSFALLPTQQAARAAAPRPPFLATEPAALEKRFSRCGIYNAMLSPEAAVRREAVRAAGVALRRVQQQQQLQQIHCVVLQEEEPDVQRLRQSAACILAQGGNGSPSSSSSASLCEDGRVLLLSNMLLNCVTDGDAEVCKEALASAGLLCEGVLPPLLCVGQCEAVLLRLLLQLNDAAASDGVFRSSHGGAAATGRAAAGAAELLVVAALEHPRVRLLLPAVLRTAAAAVRSQRRRSSSVRKSSGSRRNFPSNSRQVRNSSIDSGYEQNGERGEPRSSTESRRLSSEGAVTLKGVDKESEQDVGAITAMLWEEEEEAEEAEQRMLVVLQRMLPVALGVVWGLSSKHPARPPAAPTTTAADALASPRAAAETGKDDAVEQQQVLRQQVEEQQQQEQPQGKTQPNEAATDEETLETAALLLLAETWQLLKTDRGLATLLSDNDEAERRGSSATTTTGTAETAAAEGELTAVSQATPADAAAAKTKPRKGVEGRWRGLAEGENQQQKQRQKQQDVLGSESHRRLPAVPPYFYPVLRFTLLGPGCCSRLLFDASSSRREDVLLHRTSATLLPSEGLFFDGAPVQQQESVFPFSSPEEVWATTAAERGMTTTLADEGAAVVTADAPGSTSSTADVAAGSAEEQLPAWRCWTAAAVLEAALSAGPPFARLRERSSTERNNAAAAAEGTQGTAAAGGAARRAASQLRRCLTVALLRLCAVLQRQQVLMLSSESGNVEGSSRASTAARAYDGPAAPFAAAGRRAVSCYVDALAAEVFTAREDGAVAAKGPQAGSSTDSRANSKRRSNGNSSGNSSSNNSSSGNSNSNGNSSSSSTCAETREASRHSDVTQTTFIRRDRRSSIRSRSSSSQQDRSDGSKCSRSVGFSDVALQSSAAVRQLLRDLLLPESAAACSGAVAGGTHKTAPSGGLFAKDVDARPAAWLAGRETATVDHAAADETEACAVMRLLLLVILADLNLHAAAAKQLVSYFKGSALLLVALLTRVAAELVYPPRGPQQGLPQQQRFLQLSDDEEDGASAGRPEEEEEAFVDLRRRFNGRGCAGGPLSVQEGRHMDSFHFLRFPPSSGSAAWGAAAAADAADAMDALRASQWQSICVNSLDLALVLLQERQQRGGCSAAAECVGVLLAPQWMLLLLQLQQRKAAGAARDVVKQLLQTLLRRLGQQRKPSQQQPQQLQQQQQRGAKRADCEGTAPSKANVESSEDEEEEGTSMGRASPSLLWHFWQQLVSCGLLLQPAEMPLESLLALLQQRPTEAAAVTAAAADISAADAADAQRVAKKSTAAAAARKEEVEATVESSMDETKSPVAAAVAFATQMFSGCQHLLKLFLELLPAAVKDAAAKGSSTGVLQRLLFGTAAEAASLPARRFLCQALLLLLPLNQQQQHLLLLLSACEPAHLLPQLLPVAQVYMQQLQREEACTPPERATAETDAGATTATSVAFPAVLALACGLLQQYAAQRGGASVRSSVASSKTLAAFVRLHSAETGCNESVDAAASAAVSVFLGDAALPFLQHLAIHQRAAAGAPAAAHQQKQQNEGDTIVAAGAVVPGSAAGGCGVAERLAAADVAETDHQEELRMLGRELSQQQGAAPARCGCVPLSYAAMTAGRQLVRALSVSVGSLTAADNVLQLQLLRALLQAACADPQLAAAACFFQQQQQLPTTAPPAKEGGEAIRQPQLLHVTTLQQLIRGVACGEKRGTLQSARQAAAVAEPGGGRTGPPRGRTPAPTLGEVDVRPLQPIDELAVELVRDQLQQHFLQLQLLPCTAAGEELCSTSSRKRGKSSWSAALQQAQVLLSGLMKDTLHKLEELLTERQQQPKKLQERQAEGARESKQGNARHSPERSFLQQQSEEALVRLSRVIEGLLTILRVATMSGRLLRQQSSSDRVALVASPTPLRPAAAATPSGETEEQLLRPLAQCCRLLASYTWSSNSSGVSGQQQQQQGLLTTSLLGNLLHCCCVVVQCAASASADAPSRLGRQGCVDMSNSSSSTPGSAAFCCSVFDLVDVSRAVACVLAAAAATAPCSLRAAGCLLSLQTYLPPVFAAIAAADAADAQQRARLCADLSSSSNGIVSAGAKLPCESSSSVEAVRQYHSCIAEGEMIGMCCAVLTPLCATACNSGSKKDSRSRRTFGQQAAATPATESSTSGSSGEVTAAASYRVLAKTLVESLGVSAWVGAACTLLRCWEASSKSGGHSSSSSTESDSTAASDAGQQGGRVQDADEEAGEGGEEEEELVKEETGENEKEEDEAWLGSRKATLQYLEELLHTCVPAAADNRKHVAAVVYSRQLHATARLASAALLFAALAKQQQQQNDKRRSTSSRRASSSSSFATPAAGENDPASSVEGGEEEKGEERHAEAFGTEEAAATGGDDCGTYRRALQTLPRAARRLLRALAEGLAAGSRAAAASRDREARGLAARAEEEEEKGKAKAVSRRPSLPVHVCSSRAASSALLFVFTQLKRLGLPTLEAVYFFPKPQQQLLPAAARAAAGGEDDADAWSSAAAAPGDADYESVLELTQALLSLEILLERGGALLPQQDARPWPQQRQQSWEETEEAPAAAGVGVDGTGKEEQRRIKGTKSRKPTAAAAGPSLLQREEQRQRALAFAAAEDQLLRQRVAILLESLFKALSPLVGCVRIALGCLAPDMPHSFFLCNGSSSSKDSSGSVSSASQQQRKEPGGGGLKQLAGAASRDASAASATEATCMFAVRSVLSDVLLPDRKEQQQQVQHLLPRVRQQQQEDEPLSQLVEQQVVCICVGRVAGRAATGAAEQAAAAGGRARATVGAGAGTPAGAAAAAAGAAAAVLQKAAVRSLQQEEQPTCADLFLWGKLLQRLAARLQQYVAQEAAAARNAATEDRERKQQAAGEDLQASAAKKKHRKKQPQRRRPGVQTPQNSRDTRHRSHDVLWNHLPSPWTPAALAPAYELLLAVLAARFLLSSGAPSQSASEGIVGRVPPAATANAAATGHAWRFAAGLGALAASQIPQPFRSTCLLAITATLRRAATATTATAGAAAGGKRQADAFCVGADGLLNNTSDACRCLAALALPKTAAPSQRQQLLLLAGPLSTPSSSLPPLLPRFNTLVHSILTLLRTLLAPCPRQQLQQLERRRQELQQQTDHPAVHQQQEEGQSADAHTEKARFETREAKSEDVQTLQMKLLVRRMQQRDVHEVLESLLAALLSLLQDVNVSMYIEYLPQLLELLVNPFLVAAGRQQQRALLQLARGAAAGTAAKDGNWQLQQQQLLAASVLEGASGAGAASDAAAAQWASASFCVPDDEKMTAAARRTRVQQQLLLLLLRMGGDAGSIQRKQSSRQQLPRFLYRGTAEAAAAPTLSGVLLQSLDAKLAAEVPFTALLRLLLPLVSRCLTSSRSRRSSRGGVRAEDEAGHGGEGREEGKQQLGWSTGNSRDAVALEDCRAARFVELLGDAVSALQQREAERRHDTLQKTFALLIELFIKRVEAAAIAAAATGPKAAAAVQAPERQSAAGTDVAVLLYGGEIVDVHYTLLLGTTCPAAAADAAAGDASADAVAAGCCEGAWAEVEEAGGCGMQQRPAFKKKRRRRAGSRTETELAAGRGECGSGFLAAAGGRGGGPLSLSSSSPEALTLLPSRAAVMDFLPAAGAPSGSVAACIEAALLQCFRCWAMKLNIEQLRSFLLQLVRNVKCGNAVLLQFQQQQTVPGADVFAEGDRDAAAYIPDRKRRRATGTDARQPQAEEEEEQQQKPEQQVLLAFGGGYSLQEVCGSRFFVLLFWCVLLDYGDVGAVEALLEDFLPDLESVMAACSNNALANAQTVRHANKKQKRGGTLFAGGTESQQQRHMGLQGCCSPTWWWFELGLPTLLSLHKAVRSWNVATSGELPSSAFQRLLTSALHALQVLAALPQLPLSSSACTDVQAAATEQQLQQEEMEEDRQILAELRSRRHSSKSPRLIARLWLLALCRFVEALFDICTSDKQRLEELNLVLLEKLRSCRNSSVRCAGIAVYIHLWKKYRLAMVDCINDSLPVFGELLEDTDEEVEFSTRQLIRCIEQITNESLTERLKF